MIKLTGQQIKDNWRIVDGMVWRPCGDGNHEQWTPVPNYPELPKQRPFNSVAAQDGGTAPTEGASPHYPLREDTNW